MDFLTILALVLGILVIVRLMNVSQLASVLSGDNEEDEQDRHNHLNRIGMMFFMVVGLGLMIYMTLKYQPFMLPESASKHGVKIDFLLNLNFAVIGLVFFITQIFLFWFVYKYIHDRKRRALFYPDNHKLEFIWTIIPTIVLAALIVTGLKEWNQITQNHPDNGMKVQVYGKQFAWIARYAGPDNKLGRSSFKLISDENPLGVDYSDPAAADDIMTKSNEMLLPKGVPIQFQFNSQDVIHSAYFPHFRTQMNCVPGMNTAFYMEPTITTDEMRKITNNEKFDYILVCNKVCGVAHYNMNMKVTVVEPAAFTSWLGGEKKVVPAGFAANSSDKKETPAAVQQTSAL